MSSVERGRAEIVIVGMDFETFKRINRRLSPLPCVPDDVVELSLRKFGDGTTGCQIVEMNIGSRALAMRDFGQSGHIIQPIPFVFGWQSVRLTGGSRLPVTECFGLMVVYLHGPVPRHGYFPGHQTQVPLRTLPDPEGGMLRLYMTSPLPSLFFPESLHGIAIRLNKGEEFLIAH